MLQADLPIGWTPIPDSSQDRALEASVYINHVLYTGTRGPGKTDTQLMAFRQFVGIGYGPFWRGIIFDREYKMLDDLVSKSKRHFKKFGDGAQFLTAKSDYKWIWPTGEELLIRSMDDPEDYWLYHGQEFPFIGWNELCKYPTSECYDRMMSCNRSSFTQKDWPIDRATGLQIPVDTIPLRVFSTTNSLGPGHNWVKRRFISPANYGEVIRKKIDVFNPQTQSQVTIEKKQVAIFGSYRENIYLSPEYIAELESIDDPTTREAWLDGSWEIVAGGAIDDVWSPKIHIIPRCVVPKDTYIDRAMDWGSTQPFYVGWFAEAEGEDWTREDGSIWTPQAGSLILIYELYGAKETGTNRGLKLSATDLALNIDAIEEVLLENGWINDRPRPGPADNQIRNVNDSGTQTIEKGMQDGGVYWEPSDKARGTRKIGLQLFRNRLEAAKRGEGPGFYIMDNCRVAIELLPALPRNPDDMDDVDTSAEDHPWDAVRFRVLKGNNRFARKINVKFAT
jgi:hypothetical protein